MASQTDTDQRNDNMRWVEFLGAEGVGKTTLNNELVKARKKEDNWMTIDEASVKLAYKYSKEKDQKSFANLIALMLLRLTLPKYDGLKMGLSNLILQAPQEEATRWNKSYHLFLQSAIDFCTVSQCDQQSNSYYQQARLQMITRLVKYARRTIYLESVNGSELVVIEVGAVSKHGLSMPYGLENWVMS